MSSRLLRFAAATTVAAIPTLMLAGHASAHASNASANCNGITTSLQFFENAAGDRVYTSIDGTLVDTFNGPFVTTTHTVPVPQDGAAHSWTVVVDSVSGTGGTQYDATYNGAVGPCGEVIVTTTTIAPTTTTELVTTTTAQETTTSLLTTTTSTTLPDVSTTTSVTTGPPTSTSTTTQPSTSSSVASTSTTSPEPTTSTTAPATSSTTPPAPSSTTPECSDNPNTPTDDCAPICQPVTLDDGSNSCYRLPATGSNTAAIIIAAWIAILAGIVALGYGAAHRKP